MENSTLLHPSVPFSRVLRKAVFTPDLSQRYPVIFNETPCGTAATVFRRRLVQHLMLSPAQPTAANHISRQSHPNATQ